MIHLPLRIHTIKYEDALVAIDTSIRCDEETNACNFVFIQKCFTANRTYLGRHFNLTDMINYVTFDLNNLDNIKKVLLHAHSAIIHTT